MICESVSESEQSITKEMIRSGDPEMSLVQENRNNQLQSINESLQKENNKLRAQFDEAVRIAKQVEDIHEKYISVSAKNDELKSKNEELEKRLEISLKVNKELTHKLAEQKIGFHEQRKSDICNLQNEKVLTEKQAKKAFDKFTQKINEIEEEKEKEKIENKVLKNLLKRINDAASHYFELTFESNENLIDFLNQPPLKIQETKESFQIPKSETAKEKSNVETSKRTQKIMKKLSDAKNRISNLTNVIDQMKKEKDSLEKECEDKIDNMNQKINQIREDHQFIEDEHQHHIRALQQKIENLKNDLMKAKSAASINNTNTKPLPPIQVTTQKVMNIPEKVDNDQTSNKHEVDALEAEIGVLTQSNDALKKQNLEYEETLNNLHSKVHNLEIELEESKNNYNKVFNDFSAMNLIHESTTKEVETLRNVLHVAKPSTQVSCEKAETKNRKKIKMMKKQMLNLENEIKQYQAKEIEQTTENEDQLKEIESQKIILKKENENLNLQIIQLNEEIRNLSKELNLLKYSSNSQNSNNDDHNHENTKENEDISLKLRVPARIKQLEDCYKGKFEANQKEKNEAIEQKNQIKKEFDDFLVKLSSVISNRPIFYQNQEDFIDALFELKKSHDSLKQENTVLNSFFHHFIEVFEIPPNQQPQQFQQPQIQTQQIAQPSQFHQFPQIQSVFVQQQPQAIQFPTQTLQLQDTSLYLTYIDDVMERMNKMKRILKKKKNIVRQLQQTLSQINKSKEDVHSKLKISLENEEKLNETLTKFEDNNKKYIKQIQKQEEQIKVLEKTIEENEMINQANQHNELMKYKKSEFELREQIHSLNLKIEEINRQNVYSNEENTHLTDKIRSQKSKIYEVRLQRNTYSKELNSLRNEVEQEFNKERGKYENSIQELRNINDKQRKDTELLAQKLIATQNKLKRAKSYVKSIREEHAAFNQSINDQKDQLEREKQIIINNAKTQILATETKFSSKLEARKSHWEKEKRKILSYAADQFREFFNPGDTIDEASYKNVINRVREELIKLNSTDAAIRKLVCADSRQKTEDAVAQIVMR